MTDRADSRFRCEADRERRWRARCITNVPLFQPCAIFFLSQDLSRKHGVHPERLGSMQEELRVELDELVLAAEALPLAREKENTLRLLAEQMAGQLSAVRRRYANVRRR